MLGRAPRTPARGDAAGATEAANAAVESVQRLGIHRHPLARSLVARKLLRRLIEDGTCLARRDAKAAHAPYALRRGRSDGLNDATASSSSESRDSDVDGRYDLVRGLVQALSELRDLDAVTIDTEIPELLHFGGGEDAPEGQLRARALAQAAGSEPMISLELLGQLLMRFRYGC